MIGGMAIFPALPGEAADLTPGAAFIVHLAVRPAAAATRAVPQCGRVEHVLSGAATHFSSISDLVTFMAETLARCGEGAEPPGPAPVGTTPSAGAGTDSR